MQDRLFPENMPAHEIKDNLQAMAHSIENTYYYVQLTQEELDLKREKLTDNLLKVHELEIQKKTETERIKNEQKPLKEEMTELMRSLKTKSEEVKGTLYHVDDQEAGQMNSYDEKGNLIQTRRLRPDERQASMFNIKQAK